MKERVSPLSSPRDQVPEQMARIWATELDGVLPVPLKLDDKRRHACRARLAGDLDQWRAHCQQIRGSPFLVGEAITRIGMRHTEHGCLPSPR